MTTLNEFFDHIYVINIDAERKAYINEELKRHNIEAEIFNGINGNFAKFDKIKSIDNTIDYALHPLTFENKINIANASVIFTHKLIMIDAIVKGYENILILEDDVVFIDNFQKQFSDLIKELPDDWEVLYLGPEYFLGRPTHVSKKIGRASKTLCGTAAVGVNCKNFEGILNNMPLTVPVDVFYMSLEDKLNIYVPKKVLIAQNRKFKSSIYPKEKFGTPEFVWNQSLEEE